jgi:pimeloyl-ACP methyl ester carboxylesterase
MAAPTQDVKVWRLAIERKGGIRVAAAALCFVVGLLPAPVTVAAASDGPKLCSDVQACQERVQLSGGRFMPVYANGPIANGASWATRVLIVIHGNGRNADNYFQYGESAAKKDGENLTTLVLAPHFTITKDAADRAENQLYWTRSAGWKRGDRSSSKSRPRISAFEIIDLIFELLGNRERFPNLNRVVIAGHSAGGQFVQRYAAGHPDDATPAHLRVRYVVANPSSYLYFDPQRPIAGGADFAIPPNAADCAYDRYKFGLQRRNAYMNAATGAGLTERYRRRDVVYLLGDMDTDPYHRSLDKRCAAAAQGLTRFARGNAYKAYLDRFQAPHSHRLLVVPGVAHNGRKMLTSKAGIAALFR